MSLKGLFEGWLNGGNDEVPWSDESTELQALEEARRLVEEVVGKGVMVVADGGVDGS